MSTTVHFEDARVSFKNFRGLASTYTSAGERFFTLSLDEITAKRLLKEGWNVRMGYGKLQFLRVKLDKSYDQDLSHLDLDPFRKAEVFVEGRPWAHHKKDGVTAFLISITPKQ